MAVPSQKEKVQANLAAHAAQNANTATATVEDAEKPFKQIVREAFAAGTPRAKIAKTHGVTYQRIFAITKGMTGEGLPESQARPRAVLEDGTLHVDKIREMFEEGNTVGQIAKALDVSYQIVYQATKKQRAALAAGETPEGEEVEGEESETESDEDELEDDDLLEEEESEEESE